MDRRTDASTHLPRHTQSLTATQRVKNLLHIHRLMSTHPKFIYILTAKMAYFKQLHPDLGSVLLDSVWFVKLWLSLKMKRVIGSKHVECSLNTLVYNEVCVRFACDTVHFKCASVAHRLPKEISSLSALRILCDFLSFAGRWKNVPISKSISLERAVQSYSEKMHVLSSGMPTLRKWSFTDRKTLKNLRVQPGIRVPLCSARCCRNSVSVRGRWYSTVTYN
jgi:hypothetical protein